MDQIDNNDIATFIIDGNNFKDINSFYDECERAFNIKKKGKKKCVWGRNLDALNDILRGGIGDIPENDFILIWKNSKVSKQRLGHQFDQIVQIISNIQLRLE